MMRLVHAQWCSLGELRRMTRMQVMDACEWLEAYREIEAPPPKGGKTW